MSLAPAADRSSAASAEAAAAREARASLWWHSGWALALALAVVGISLAAPWPNATPGLALIIGAAPAMMAILTDRVESPAARIGLLAVWSAAAAIAANLTGGLEGPLVVWCATPLAASLLMGRGRIAWGATLSLVSLAAVALAQSVGGVEPRPEGALAISLSLVGLSTAILGFAAAILIARPADAPVAARPTEGLAAEQPNLIMALTPDGLVAAARGALSEPLAARLRSGGVVGAAPLASRPGVQEALAQAAREGRASVAFALAGDDPTWLQLDLARTRDGRLVGVARDATAEKAHEAELETARADAEALNVGKSRFLANMSHELRTPLNAIMGFSDMMRQRIFGPLPGRYVEYADLIHDAGAHLLDLINDVLDMSKIEAAKYELDLEALDAREPVSAALRLMRLQADDAGIQLRGLLPSEPLDARADRRALKQITLNLVSNALKFTPRGGLVTVSLARIGGAMELSVADTGLGIAEADLQRLGRPYEQAGDASQQAKGTGLGLSLVRAFAELHGGEMSIESRLGEGTAVTVRLPVLAGPEEAAPEPPPPAIGGGAEVIAFKPQR